MILVSLTLVHGHFIHMYFLLLDIKEKAHCLDA